MSPRLRKFTLTAHVVSAAGWIVLVPFAPASLLTGLVQALGTRWGLFRHYWVVVKFTLTIVSAVVVVLYTQTLAFLADVARTTENDLSGLRSPGPVLHAGIGNAAVARRGDLVGVQAAGLDSIRRAPAVEQP